jgi:class 3 adenylate cyclase
LRRLLEIGASPSDSGELRVRKAVLVLSSTLMAGLASVWVATYALLGLWVSAALPLSYQVASAASIYVFARTHRYLLFRASQLCMSLLLPFALQWSLGGFETSSAVCLWAITSPLGALLFVGARQALPWFVAFVGLVAVSAAIDPLLATEAPDIPQGVVVTFFALNILGVATTAYALLQYFVRARERALTELAREHRALEVEQAKSERLLLNVLPRPVAARLKEQQGIIAEDCPAVTVLFADIVGFTPLSQRLSASEVVSLLDGVFARWDAVAADHGVEKIKTIGDAYMVAGGIPLPRDDHVEAIAEMALAMGPEVARCSAETGLPLEVRIGIDTGPVVAGVIGRAKFIYDLWGDTVNTASRMESHALPGTIQVTERTYERLRHRYQFRERGMIEVKGKGPMPCYLLIGTCADPAVPSGREPHQRDTLPHVRRGMP